MRPRRALFLFGSGRPIRSSTSEALGGHLIEGLVAGGMDCDALHVSHLRGERADQRLVPALEGAELFVLAAPVYVDALPYLVTHCLERVYLHRCGPGASDTELPPPTRMVALVNCGYPGVRHTETTLSICRAFARRAGLPWAGGLGLAAGEAIHGAPIAGLGRMGRNVRASLDLAAEALLAGEPIPDEAVELMARPLMPDFAYRLLANVGWAMSARRNGALGQMRDQPLS